MIAIKEQLLAAVQTALQTVAPESSVVANLEVPKVASHGDFALTAAMQLAKPLKKNPRDVANALVEVLSQQAVFQQWVAGTELAGPGFINIRLTPEAKQQVVREVLAAGPRFGARPIDGSVPNKKLLVEFVSANPTGPLHVGHGRQAALGDAICNLFASQGWDVWREFYYNDAGVQIQTLANSTQARARGLKPGDVGWPESAYNGDYIDDIAKDFLAKKTVSADDRSYTASGDVDDLDSIRQFAVAYLRREQDLDLQAFHVKFDHYYLESSLYTDGRVDDAVAKLQAAGKTFEADGALWLRSTDYGDDKDRVMRKTDGSYTYFVPDVAYHMAKWERGFEKVINIQGMDHHGTIARVRAGLQAANVGIPAGYPDYVLHTMVRVMRGGEEVKISKRAGSYVTLRDLITWTSKDAVRFFLLSRKPDTEYVFDVDLAVAKNNDNPVYYVQYAHARICSVLATWGGDVAHLGDVDLSALAGAQAQSLLMQIAKYPDMLRDAAEDMAPHDVAFYLRDLAASYHSYYDAERILVDDESVKAARLALIAATAQVLRNGLKILGVDAPDRM
ncbi:MAG: arginine--tRNA ligase [Burkholderiaceae bacterium]|jgi:arginyl-tRNA synthetase|nr:arginine--tRNA ligase [Burkholderiaceae bacterium]MDP4862364.1 arginine--tRNA ligase [Burkholderiaceae bacterium]